MKSFSLLVAAAMATLAIPVHAACPTDADAALKPADLAKMTDQDRLELFKSMLAYGGTFKVEGSRVIHNVDISWNENWTGAPHGRNFRIEGNRLTLSTDPTASSLDGKRVTAVLVWEKIP